MEAIAFAKSCNNKAAARKFNVAPKTIRDWIRKEEQLRLMKQSNAYGGKRLRLAVNMLLMMTRKVNWSSG